jgi:hypothetical protein
MNMLLKRLGSVCGTPTSQERNPTPNFADDLLPSLLILPDDPVIPSHDHSIITTPSFEIPIDVAVDVAV